MKTVLEEAGLSALHELPWCTDLKSYRPGTRFFLQICSAVGLGWAVYYKFQIAAVRKESVQSMQALKLSVENESFFPEPGILGLLKKGIALMARR
jgi:hypothetical protein